MTFRTRRTQNRQQMSSLCMLLGERVSDRRKRRLERGRGGRHFAHAALGNPEVESGMDCKYHVRSEGGEPSRGAQKSLQICKQTLNQFCREGLWSI